MPVKGDSEYKQFYYDLASLDKDVRLKAANGLLEYLQDKVSANEIEEYHNYTVERLIKGLASSRDAARQGFSIVLCEVLKSCQMPVSQVLELIDQHMQITSSLDGHEERDIKFGILFGYMIIIRSGRLNLKANTDASLLELVIKMFEKIWALHMKRNWIQEITIETLMSLMVAYPHPTFLSTCSDKIGDYLSIDLEQQSANHLLLKLSLGFSSKQHNAIEQHVVSKLDTLASFQLSTDLETYGPALVNACKKFPQVHKVWDYLLGFVFSLTTERELPSTRLHTLSSQAHENFELLMAFLSTHLWAGSKEKRATAMKLTETCFRIIPSSSIPVLLTPHVIHSILVCRGKGRGGAGAKGGNLLFEFAGGVLNNMLKMVMGGEGGDGGDEASKLALLTVLSQHSRGQFDQQSQTHTVQTITSSLSGEGVGVYVDLLVSSLIGTLEEENNARAVSKDNSTKDESGDDGEEDEEDDAAHVSEYRKSLMLSLVSLAKSQMFSPTSTSSDFVASLVSLLLRMTIFADGKTKKPKKKGTGESLSLVTKVEDTVLLSSFSDEEVQLLSLHAQSLVTDMFMKAGGKGGASGITAMYSVWGVFVTFVSSLPLRPVAGSEKVDEDEGESDIGALVSVIDKHIQSMHAVSTKEGENNKSLAKFCEASISLLILCTLHHFFHRDISLSSIAEGSADVWRIAQEVSSGKGTTKESKEKAKGSKGKGKVEESGSDSEDEDEGSENMLFEFSVDLLSSVSEVASRGVREGVKRVWGAYLPLMSVEQQQGEMVDRMVSMVLEIEEDGEDEEAEMDVEGEEGEEDGDGHEEEEEEEEKAQQSIKKKDNKKAGAVKNTKNTKNSNKQHESDVEEEGEDIVIPEDDMFAFLMSANQEQDLAEGNSDDDDEAEGVLVHTEEADAALAHMIATRKEHRKAGLLAAKNKQLLLRMRVLDILEVFIHKTTEDYVVMCMYRPMLLAYRKSLKSKVLEQLPVGAAFISRLEGVIGQELVKRKLNLAFPSTIATCPPDEIPQMLQESGEELSELLQSIQHCLHSKDARLRHLAQEYIVSLARSVSALGSMPSEKSIKEHSQNIDKTFTDFVSSLLSTFITKRRSDVTGKWLDNLLVTRYPVFFLPRLWEVVLSGISTNIVYARGMVCEMVGGLVKRCGSSKLDTSISGAVYGHLGALVAHVSQAVKSTAEEGQQKSENAKDQSKASKSSKQTKPVLQLLKTVLEFLASEKADKSQINKHIRIIRSNLETIHQSLALHGEGNKYADECKALVEKVTLALKSVEEAVPSVVEAMTEADSKKGKGKDKNKAEGKNSEKSDNKTAKKAKSEEKAESAVEVQMDVVQGEVEGDGKKKRAERKRSMSEDSTASTSSRVTRSGRAGLGPAVALPAVQEEDAGQKKKKSKK